MRIEVELHPIDEVVALPVHYNAIVQGFIYRHLEAALAQQIHEEGWTDKRRRLKLFTFSRLQGKFRRQGERLYFAGPLRLVIASPVEAFLESLAMHLIRAETLKLGASRVALVSVEVTMPPHHQRPVLLKSLSPITVYSTLQMPDGRKKTYYYAPQEPEFARQVLANLRRKVRAWTGADLPEDGATTFRPVKVSTRNLSIVKYKGTVIKGWTGIYELDAPEPYFRMALDAGLGAKNSQGFGCVEVW